MGNLFGYDAWKLASPPEGPDTQVLREKWDALVEKEIPSLSHAVAAYVNDAQDFSPTTQDILAKHIEAALREMDTEEVFKLGEPYEAFDFPSFIGYCEDDSLPPEDDPDRRRDEMEDR